MVIYPNDFAWTYLQTHILNTPTTFQRIYKGLWTKFNLLFEIYRSKYKYVIHIIPFTFVLRKKKNDPLSIFDNLIKLLDCEFCHL